MVKMRDRIPAGDLVSFSTKERQGTLSSDHVIVREGRYRVVQHIPAGIAGLSIRILGSSWQAPVLIFSAGTADDPGNGINVIYFLNFTNAMREGIQITAGGVDAVIEYVGSSFDNSIIGESSLEGEAFNSEQYRR